MKRGVPAMNIQSSNYPSILFRLWRKLLKEVQRLTSGKKKGGLDYLSDDIQVLGCPCSIISKSATIQVLCVNLVSISLECRIPK